MLSNSSKFRLIALAKKAIANRGNHKIEKGVASKFIKISESWGVKFSECYGKYDMEGIFKRQVAAHAIGKGPMAFGFFDFDGIYGYITEIVKVIGYVFSTSSVDDIENEKLSKRLMMGIKHLVNVMEKKLHFTFHDSHLYNVGFMRGQVVCIDFGCE